MAEQIIIENPILNSPFEEPARHFKFDDEGITNEVAERRRVSAYFVPVPRPRKRGKQKGLFETEWTENRLQENEFINDVRGRVELWRKRGRPGTTKLTARLLEHWTRPEREPRLFFCQIEAAETAIYIAEAADRQDPWILTHLGEQNDACNPGLFRMAFKMATGSGKTVLMAMLIAWQALNKLRHPQSSTFSDTFLVVTPGITIRDRLRVLLPNDPDNYYRKFDIVPGDMVDRLHQAKIVVTNFHQMLRRERVSSSKLTKAILTGDGASPFQETPDQMVRRVCREFGSKQNIGILNDEGHHCYRRAPDEDEGPLKGDERKEAKKRNEQARVWISGLEAIQAKIGIRAIYDLSATPFFLRGSGYAEGTLFPWVVSDFSLIDAIESGIVKIPRVPVADNSMTGELPTYRDIWVRIRDDLPKKGRGTQAVTGEPKLPLELEGALKTLYDNYEQYYRLWEEDKDAQAKGQTPPVFIVVCNNTNVSKLVFDYVAGWEKELGDGSTIVVPGKLPVFSNEQGGAWSARPNTILVDSEQLESGEAMSREFKKAAAAEIDEFKAQYRERFPGADLGKLTDEDLLREVCNTVGKQGLLGEQIKCVVSVSMLTEGWDANTVTHILGVRAFGTQLLCEQVVGRGLRRRSYAVDDDGRFSPEYAEVYGVPFSFIPCSGSQLKVEPGPIPTRVRAFADRHACCIEFPRLIGYRYDLASKPLSASFTNDSRYVLSTEDIPTETLNKPIVGESVIHTLDELKAHRLQEVDFLLAKLLIEKYFRRDSSIREDRPKEHHFDREVQAWRFPEVLPIVRRWRTECVQCKDNTFPQLLLLLEHAHNASDMIYRAIIQSEDGQQTLVPILRPYDTVGSTEHVDFDTIRPVWATDPAKCHISHVVADTGTWEQKVAQSIEEMDEVRAYVKNQNLGFTIPYVLAGEEKNYIPDFIVRIDDGHGDGGLLSLIVEVTGRKRKDKEVKVATARDLWVPAVNNHGGLGRWAFIEITDPWNTQTEIRALLAEPAPA